MVQHHLAGMVFDLDGTLLDSERVICDSVSRACAALGKAVSAAAVAPHLGAPLTELFATFFHDGAMPAGVEDDPKYKSFHRAYIHEHDSHEDDRPRFLPGVEAALETLSQRKIPMAVATTKPTDRALVQLEALNVHHLFGHVQGTDAPMAFKPAPDVVLAACLKIGLDSTTVMMVGDTARDVGAGRASNAATGVVAYTDATFERAKGFGADVVIRSLSELLTLPGLLRG